MEYKTHCLVRKSKFSFSDQDKAEKQCFDDFNSEFGEATLKNSELLRVSLSATKEDYFDFLPIWI